MAWQEEMSERSATWMNDEDSNGAILVSAEIDVSGRSVPEELPRE